MLTKTARWLTLTNGFHPIQRAPGYDRCSLTGGTHCRMATSECRIGKTAGGRTARLNYAVIAPRFGPRAIGEVIEDFRSLTPVHTLSSRVFSRRNRAVACIQLLANSD